MTDYKLASLRAEARHTAVKRLIDAHRDEYDRLHMEERNARGLGELQSIDALQAKIRRLEAELGTND